MEEHALVLTDEEYAAINRLSTELAAVEICQIYFRRQSPQVTFSPGSKGSDLRVCLPDATEMDIEIKGTEKPDIAWGQFKVSSQQSYHRLAAGLPLYRVSGIGSRNVKIFVLKHGVDFRLEPEARWTIKPWRGR